MLLLEKFLSMAPMARTARGPRALDAVEGAWCGTVGVVVWDVDCLGAVGTHIC